MRVGKYIADKAGYKRIVLELGGNDPLIVMEDADLDKAADARGRRARTKNSGQRCTAVKRILVVEKRRRRLRRAACWPRRKKLKAGDPMDPDDRHGHRDPRARGAAVRAPRQRRGRSRARKLLHGNDRAGRALSADRASTTCRYDCELVREETFGPVIPIIRCPNDIDEAIRISNATAYGLSSGVCTNRLDYITRFVTELQVGTVNVWEVPGYRSR